MNNSGSFFKLDYNSFSDQNPLLSLNVICAAIFTGIIVGILFTAYHKFIEGRVARALMKAGASDPDSAVLLGDAGVKKSLFIMRSLSDTRALGKVVLCSNTDDAVLKGTVKKQRNPYKTPVLDYNKAKFYIPEKKLKEAHSRYDSSEFKLSVFIMTVILLVIFSVAVYLFVIPRVPVVISDMFKFASNLMS